MALIFFWLPFKRKPDLRGFAQSSKMAGKLEKKSKAFRRSQTLKLIRQNKAYVADTAPSYLIK
jgi:hypothetical protein